MVTFAIDRIPALNESARVFDVSDGVPEPIGEEDTEKMPPAPPGSRPMVDYDKTLPFGKAKK